MIYGMPEVSWDLTLMLLLSAPNSLGAVAACSFIELYRAFALSSALGILCS